MENNIVSALLEQGYKYYCYTYDSGDMFQAWSKSDLRLFGTGWKLWTIESVRDYEYIQNIIKQ